ncbi:MAG TPA: helix-turn-helix domain-containing protein [Bryobacteraceae bacterium]|jgi:cytoskeletal protein RodZ|nr:helix-turn-helix domain-containing protein [Bryobacteraceae bacterium]
MNSDKSELGLTTIRRNRGVSLEQIARETKISLRNLRAIEEGDFGKLPGGIYNTSYIKQYAKAIDFDESLLLDYYRRKMFPDAPRDGSAEGKGKKTWVEGYPRSATSLL